MGGVFKSVRDSGEMLAHLLITLGKLRFGRLDTLHLPRKTHKLTSSSSSAEQVEGAIRWVLEG
ncbi:hypothetical protein IF1G_04515 [Cordyceps javanica]|uniref:Uncharacterized protein n=1 Tax=Cordyceps javanica TaxID=43265 RepID=A0A545V6D7_9HYPO|nr:hypothetical protein IF1G_04515 [Cordyceps javanica]